MSGYRVDKFKMRTFRAPQTEHADSDTSEMQQQLAMGKERWNEASSAVDRLRRCLNLLSGPITKLLA